MTGPEHYREAERLLTLCAGPQRGTELDKTCTAAAQVHALLALAAATALGDGTNGMSHTEYNAWRVAAGEKP